MSTKRHRRCRFTRPRRPREGGYSLIELMVAMVIALFLIGGVLVVEQSVHKSYSDQSELGQIDDAERFTMTMLGEIVSSASYYPDPSTTSLVTAFPAETTTVPNTANDALTFKSGQYLYGVSAPATVNGVAVTNDTIAVRYMTTTNNDMILCDGSTGGNNQLYVNYLYTEQDPTTGDYYLYCVVQNETSGAWGNPVQLVQNVQNMQIWYGLANGSDNNVDTYVPAASMVIADWPKVTSVKVLVTFTNPLYAKLKEKGQKPVLLFSKVMAIMGRTGS